jgi:hypothetical protein
MKFNYHDLNKFGIYENDSRMRCMSISLGRFVVMGMIASGAAFGQSSDAATLQTGLAEVH